MNGIAHGVAVAVLAFSCRAAFSQQPTPSTVHWSFSATASGYVIPDGRNYIEDVLTADRGGLHLEGRYNYEALNTGSAWIGYNFKAGSKLSMDLTPMVGAVFGDTAGFAPGQRLTLHWRRLDLLSEDEVVFNTRVRSNSFLYTWSELTVTPFHALSVGLVGQRTRAYQSARDIQRGLLVRLNQKRFSISADVLNPETRKPLYILSVVVQF